MRSILLSILISCCPLFVNGQVQADYKPALKKLADDLTQQLKQKGNMRLAVAPFTDQQNNVTELGKYLAQQFGVYLIRNGLDVLDRSRVDDLMQENKMNAKGLLDPENQAGLKRLAGIEIIVAGTTTPSDKAIELVITAIDISRGSSIAGTDGSITRTSSINDLIRTTVKKDGGLGSLQETSTISPTVDSNQDLGYVLMGDKSMDLPKTSCFSNNYNYGQICFENILSQPIVLYRVYNTGNSNSDTPNMLIGKSARNCTSLLMTGGYNKNQNMSFYFYFHTAEEEEENRRYGKMTVEVEGCKVKTRVINSDRLFLSKTKPN